MKCKICITFFIFFAPVLQAQNVTFDWAKQMGGSGSSYGTSIVLDKSGNIYTTGYFVGTIDFDPGPAVFNLTSVHVDDVFVCKTDANGNFIWAKQMGGFFWAEGWSICIDATGNLYITGSFTETVDFDPGAGVFNMTAFSGMNIIAHDIFICKLDANGSFIWAKQIGGLTETSNTFGWCSAVDNSGNIYTTGSFLEIADFDPGPGVHNLTSVTNELFVSKLDANGNFIWAKHMAGNANGHGQGLSITLDALGNIYTTGTFSDTVDFDPGVGVYNLSSSSMYGTTFISKLDRNGNFIWAKQMGTDNSLGSSLTTDAVGNVYATGVFIGTGDFDPGPGIYSLTGVYDMFVSKLDAAGNFIWVKQMGGNGHTPGTSIKLDASGNVYTTGYLHGTADFDPGVCVFNLTSNGYYEMFISKLDAAGNFVWAKKTTGTQYARGTSIALDPLQNIYTTGTFSKTVDFDPGFAVYNLSSVDFSMFIHKMSPCTNSTTSTINITACKPFTINCKTYTTNGVYTFVLENAIGCDSIVTMNLVFSNVPVTSNVTASACKSYFWNGQTYNNTGIYKDTLVSFTGCDSIVSLNLTIGNLSVKSVISASACSSYFWNGQAYTSSGIYPDTLISANGCDSIVTLNLTIANIPVTSVAVSACNSYSWNNQTYTVSGIYTDTLIAANACDSIVQLQLTLSPKAFTSINQTICQGQSYFGYTVTGTYIDTLLSANGCDSIRILRLTVQAKPVADLGNDKSLCSGDRITLYPGQFNTYLWQDGTSENKIVVTKTGVYSVDVTNICGTAHDEIFIKEGLCDIWFPTAFTPNNDGKNDLFRALGTFNTAEYYLVVYNRWGQKIFETKDYNKGWQGNYKEQLQNAGIYVWHCRFKKLNTSQNKILQGTVLLIR